MEVLKPEQDPDFVDYSRSETPEVSNDWSESRIAEDLATELQAEHEQVRSEPKHVNIPLKNTSKDKRLIIIDDMTGCELVTSPVF